MTLLPSSPPLVSIIMPTYNRAEYILETIRSIQKQTYSTWELVIIDDGSKDETSQIIKGIKDDRIFYDHTCHLGLEHARNRGLEKAKGEFIAFMDSDDLWAPTKLQKQVAYFVENPNISFTLTGGYEFTTPGEPLVYYYKQRSGASHGDLFVKFFQSKFVATTPSLLFRNQCLGTVSFAMEMELADIHFILSLANQYAGSILYEPLLYRRLHDDNISTLHRAKKHQDGINLIKSYRSKLPRQIFTDALLRTHINCGENCLQEKNKLEAIKEFIRGWKYEPLNIVPLKKIAKALLS